MSYSPPGFPDDHANPYNPPTAEIGKRPVGLPPIGVIPFTVDSIVSRSWNIFKQRWGICLGAVFVCNGLIWLYQIVSQTLPAAFTGGGQEARLFGAFLLFALGIGSLFFQLWLTLGQSLVLLKVARGLPAVVGEVFDGGRFIWRMLLATLLFGLVFLAFLVACGGPVLILVYVLRENSAAWVAVVAVAGIVGLFAWIYLAARLGQYVYLIIDRDAGVIDSIKMSAEITRGRVGTLIGVWLAVFFINIGGALACLVGLIATIPLTYLMLAVTYVALIGNSSIQSHWEGEYFPGAKPPSEPDFGGLL